MSDILLSLCISSYKRGDKCVQMVKKILSVQDDRYNIFICDDASDEDTVAKLKTLSTQKVKLVLNKKNIGACKNWFQTINCGNGRYILHILDRDDIDISKLKLILDILEENAVGAGYFGKSAMYPSKGIEKKTTFSICKKGRVAFLTMAGVAVHPTGFFVERKEWEKGQYKKYFYRSSKYGIYPHSYVLSEIAIKRDMLFSPISFYYIAYRSANKKSRFYEKSNDKDYWWLPDNVIKTGNKLLLYCCKLADDSYKGEFICRRFDDCLKRATISYKKVAADQAEMERYGFHAQVISTSKLLIISVKYWITFLYVLKKINLKKDIHYELKDIWLSNVKKITRMSKREKELEQMLDKSNNNFLLFRIMNQWVKLKQEGKILSEYFRRNSYRRIAIYGIGYIGETLIEELRNSDIEVVCGIDKNAEAVYADINIFPINKFSEIVDVIVVTVIGSFEEIMIDLKKG